MGSNDFKSWARIGKDSVTSFAHPAKNRPRRAASSGRGIRLRFEQGDENNADDDKPTPSIVVPGDRLAEQKPREHRGENHLGIEEHAGPRRAEYIDASIIAEVHQSPAEYYRVA